MTRLGLCSLLAAAALSAQDGDAQLAQRLDQLGRQIRALEQRLPATAPAATGVGAFSRGPGLRIDGMGETVLERAQRLERELAEAQAVIAGRERELAESTAREAQLMRRGSDQRERIAALEHVEDQLITARQALAERATRIDQLEARAQAAELARLRADRAYFQLAAAVLRLQANQPAPLNDLQDLIRQEARTLLPSETAAPASAPAH